MFFLGWIISFLRWFILSLKCFTSPPPPDTVTLMDMPVSVVRGILKDVDLASMMNLRKVNRNFEYFIDKNHMKNFDLDDIHIEINEDEIEIFLRKSVEEEEVLSGYWLSQFNQFPASEGQKFYKQVMELAGLRNLEIFLEGLFINLKTPLKTFAISLSTSVAKMTTASVWPSLEKVFKTNNAKIKTFEIEGFKLEHVIRFISISKPGESLMVDQLLKREGMQKAMKHREWVSARYSTIAETFHLNISTLTPQHLNFFKEILLTSATCFPLTINFFQIANMRSMPVQFRSLMRGNSCFFKKDFQKKLQVKIQNRRNVSFKWFVPQ